MDKNIKQLLESIDAIQEGPSDQLDQKFDEFYLAWIGYKKVLVSAWEGYDDQGNYKNRELASLVNDMNEIFARASDIQDKLK